MNGGINMKKRILCLTICILMLTTLFAGFGVKAASVAEKDELYIGVYCLGNLEYSMITAFEAAIAEKPAGIITFGAEDSLLPVINKAIDEGIPVVTVDGDIKNSKRIAFVGTGNYNAGVLGGRKLGEVLGGKGKVAILTEPNISLHRDRYQGYQDGLADFPDIEIVQVGDTKADPILTIQIVSAMLQKYPDLAGIGCTDAVGGAASAIAVEEAGLVGKVKILSMDRDRQVLEKIGKGIIEGTIVQKSALMPFFALQIIYNMRHADIEITTDNKAAGLVAAPFMIDTGVVFVDKTTAKYYIR
jgi:ribose transport system substrate-binding protein